MADQKPDGNLGNLVLVYILLQVVLVILGIIVADAIGVIVEMFDLSLGRKLTVLVGICLIILIILYMLRKRLLYHLSFEGISETIFSKAERKRMRELSDKWKSNTLSEPEIVEFEELLVRTGWPKGLVRKYAQKNWTVKEVLILILSISVVVPFAIWFLDKLNEARERRSQKKIDASQAPKKLEGADEDTTPSSDDPS